MNNSMLSEDSRGQHGAAQHIIHNGPPEYCQDGAVTLLHYNRLL